MPVITLRQLTQHEKLRLWRGRLGLTQEAAGLRFGVSGWTYGEMERGEIPIPTYAWRGPFEVQDHEFCLLSRLRSGMTQEEVAAELSVSRIWVNKMESGRVGCSALVRFWGKKNVW